MMRGLAYGTLAKLCQRAPQHVQSDLKLPTELFTALETEQMAARASLQEALAALATVHARRPGAPPPPPAMLSTLRALLLRSAASTSSHARYSSMVWISSAFDHADLPTRYACLLAIADPRVEVAEAAARALRPRTAAAANGAAAADGTASGAPPASASAKAAAAAAAVPSEALLGVGTRVTHVDQHGVARLGSVAAVHMDDGASGAYFTVALEDGAERSVERPSLRVRASEHTAFAPLARLLHKHAALQPPPPPLPPITPAAGTAGGTAPVDGVAAAAVQAAEALLAQAEVAHLPIDALPEAVTHLLACAKAEAMALAAHRAAAAAAAAATALAAPAAGGGTAEAAAEAAADEAAAAVVALGTFVSEELSGAASGAASGTGAPIDAKRPQRGVIELISLLMGCLLTNGATAELLQRSSAAVLELLEASPHPVARCLRPHLAALQALMLTRPAAEEGTQLCLCRILAFVTCVGGGEGAESDGVGAGGGAAEAMLKQLLPLLPSSDLTGCVGTNEQRKVVGAALGLGYVAAAAIRPSSLLPANTAAAATLPAAAALPAAAVAASLTPSLLTQVALQLANLVRHERWPVATAAATAIGQFGSAGPLPLPDGAVDAPTAEAPAEAAGNGQKEAEGGDKADEAKAMEGVESTTPPSAAAPAASAPDPSPATTASAPAPATESTTEASKPPPPVRRQPEAPSTKVGAVYCMLHLLGESKARTAAVSARAALCDASPCK